MRELFKVTPRSDPRPPPLVSTRASVLHIFALSGVAIAQPLYSALQGNMELFVARKTSRVEIVILAVLILLVPPAVMAALTMAGDVLSARAGRVIASGFVWALTALLAIQVVDAVSLGDGLRIRYTLVLAAIIATLATLAYRKTRWAGDLLRYLAAAPVLFIALFLFTTPVSAIVLPQSSDIVLGAEIPADSPIVFMVFDELPLASLLDESGQIDRDRFPNFARLANSSVWFRNSVAAHPYSTRSISTLLSGTDPESSREAVASQLPGSLFTLLANSYEMHVVEPITDICPQTVCNARPAPRSFTQELTGLARTSYKLYPRIVTPTLFHDTFLSLDDPFGVFARVSDPSAAEPPGSGEEQPTITARINSAVAQDKREVFRAFIHSIDGKKGQLYYQHFFLPHAPYHYLPSGVSYNRTSQAIEGLSEGWWVSGEPWFAFENYQRHLLQVKALDLLLGELIEHLEAIGTFDETTIVLTSDHGVSHQSGDARRAITPGNLNDIAWVPLLIKLPNQVEGIVDDSLVQGQDVLPTIAEILGTDIPWAVDGISALADNGEGRSTLTILDQDFNQIPLVPLGWSESVANKSDLFGVSVGEFDLFAFGAHRELVGTATSALGTSQGSLSAELDNPEILSAVKPESGFVPAFVSGVVRGDGLADHLFVAVGVNGVVGAVVPVFEREPTQGRFQATVPDWLFVDGINRITLHALVSDAPAAAIAIVE